MALNCNRQPFQFEDGCPSVKVDLNFPDFNACATAEPSRLKSVSRLNIQKAPAFQMFIPVADPLPVPDFDIDIDIDSIDVGCPFEDLDSGDMSVSVHEDDTGESHGSLSISHGDDNPCAITGLHLDLYIPPPVIPTLSYEDGTVVYTFANVAIDY